MKRTAQEGVSPVLPATTLKDLKDNKSQRIHDPQDIFYVASFPFFFFILSIAFLCVIANFAMPFLLISHLTRILNTLIHAIRERLSVFKLAVVPLTLSLMILTIWLLIISWIWNQSIPLKFIKNISFWIKIKLTQHPPPKLCLFSTEILILS